MASQDGNSSLPPMMAFPGPEIRRKINIGDWSTCLQAWEVLTQAYLGLNQQAFEKAVSEDASSLTSFLTSYMSHVGTVQDDENLTVASHDKILQRNVFLLLHRTFTHVRQPAPSLLDWAFWGDVSRVYRHSPSLEQLMEAAWTKLSKPLESSLSTYKLSLMKQLDAGKRAFSGQDSLSLRLLPLLRACPSAGKFTISGSDLLDSVNGAYQDADANSRSRLVLLVYLGLNALTLGQKPSLAVLTDQLYGLKATAEPSRGRAEEQQTLLADLVTDTPILSRLRKQITMGMDSTRLSSLITALEKYKRPQSSRPRRVVRRKFDKPKTAEGAQYGHSAFGDIHVHKMSLITQLQDLFPDLGSAFVSKLLDEYNDNAEEVTAHLLEDSLPSHLKGADRSEVLPPTHAPSNDIAPHLAPRPTPPTSPGRERRNVFDNDELDQLTVDASRLHIGRRNAGATADKLLSEQTEAGRTTSKAAILSALAAFDADDDEHDDTYDLEDVGGTVDSARPGGADEADAGINDMREKNEEALYSAFKMNPEIFDRSSATRLTQPRRALKSETGMTDEAIEGWAIMLRRDPRQLRKLELKYNTFGGQQTELASTAWRAQAESGTEESETSGAEGGRGGFRGRGGRGRGGGMGRGGRAGNVTGSANEKGTQVARDRKEANKGSRANHNRRDQRARKVARAGFPG